MEKIKKSKIDKPEVVGKRIRKILTDNIEEDLKNNKVCKKCK